METNGNFDNRNDDRHLHNSRSGRVFGGTVLVVIGILFMAREAGAYFPHWLFSWPMILIAVGTYVGARHSFRLGGWLIPIAIGSVFLFEDVFYDLDIKHYLWPSMIIMIGLIMILRPRRGRINRWNSTTSAEDNIDSVNIFGGTKKNVISKDFKGGEITTFFGGTDLNLMQSDINGTATIDITTAFGGIKLVVPPHWNLKSEVVCMFGGIDDKRHLSKEAPDMSKTLILKGTVIFGGIDIKSY